MSEIEKAAEIAGAADFLPCPFCGSEKVEDIGGLQSGPFPRCMKCGARPPGPFSEGKRNAVDVWNTRSALTPPKGYVLVPVRPTEAMVDAVESIKMPHAYLRTGVRIADFNERYSAMLAARPEVP